MLVLNTDQYLVTNQGLTRSITLEKGLIVRKFPQGIQKIESVEQKKINCLKFTLSNNLDYYLYEENSLINELDIIKKCNEYNVGDFVKLNFYNFFNNNGEKDINWHNEMRASAIPVMVPEKLSNKMAFWCGLMISTGQKVKSGAIKLEKTDKNKNLIDDFIKLTKEVFDITPFEYEYDQRIFYEFNSTNLLKFIYKNFGFSKKFRKVPLFILNGSISEKVSFIEGLSMKGFYDKGRNYVFSSNSKILVDFVLSFLNTIGYIMQFDEKKSGQGNSIYYCKIVGVNPDYIPLNSYNPHYKEDSNKMNYLIRTPKDLFNIPIAKNNTSRSYLHKVKKENRSLVKADALYKTILKENDYFFDHYFLKIKRIEKVEINGIALDIPENNSLIINGLIVKN